jgi:hypothetical protein
MKILLVHTPFDWKRPITILSHLIRKVARTFYNHASFLVEIKGVLYILESDINGVVKVKYVDWVKEQIISVYEIPDELQFKSGNRAKAMIGHFSYSFFDLLWFMPIYIFTNKWYGRTIEEASNKPTCYEYIARVMEFKNWYRMTPNELKTEMESRGFLQTHYNIKAKHYENIGKNRVVASEFKE